MMHKSTVAKKTNQLVENKFRWESIRKTRRKTMNAQLNKPGKEIV